MAEGITVYGVTWCPDCKGVKKILGEYQIPGHGTIRMMTSMPEAMSRISNGGEYRVPTLLFPDSSVLTESANAEGYSYVFPSLSTPDNLDDSKPSRRSKLKTFSSIYAYSRRCLCNSRNEEYPANRCDLQEEYLIVAFYK